MKKWGQGDTGRERNAPQQVPAGGLFSSSLVPHETSGEKEKPKRPKERKPAPDSPSFARLSHGAPFDIPPATATETDFRHGFWSADRNVTIEALRGCGVPESRLERFINCGSDCIIEVSDDGQAYRLRANYCRDRFCVPCANARAKVIAENLTTLAGASRLRFITLTRAADDLPLSKCIDELGDSFRRLRDMRDWRQAVSGGAAFIEITRGKEGTHWHVHLHMLVVGTFLAQDVLSRMWERASGGSRIVDIRAVPDKAGMVSYVAKYATKGFSHQIYSDRDWLMECILALRARRLLMTFGDWYGQGEDDITEDYRTWKRVGRLDQVASAAARGETWAHGVFLALKRAIEVSPEGIRFARAADNPIGPPSG